MTVLIVLTKITLGLVIMILPALVCMGLGFEVNIYVVGD